MKNYTRRQFNRGLLAGVGSMALTPILSTAAAGQESGNSAGNIYKIAVMSWSFHMALWRGQMKATELPEVARSLGVDVLEWTAKTFRDLKAGPEAMFRAPPPAFFHELRRASDAVGVHNKVMSAGGPFFLASVDSREQQKALDYFLQ